jgi:hypothetical protein
MTAPRDIDAPTYDNIPREQVAPLLRKNLPAVVRKLKAFVVFKFKPPKKPGGKRMKLPFYVVDGRMRHGEQASQEDRTRLVSFPDAVKLFERDRKWGGIGVCALESNDCFFVDLDNCFNEHLEPNALAQTLLAWNTYTEYSPSGRGLRMVFGGNPGVNRKRHDLGLELFCSSGFVTLTGLRYDKAHADVKQLTTRQQQKLAELLGAPLTKHEEQDLNSIPSPIDKNRRKDINRALHKMDPDMGYAQWLMVGQALHSGDPDPAGWGFQKWLSWSQGGDKFEQTNEQEMLRKWHGFKQGKGITVNTLFGIAKEYGFNPKELADNDNNDEKEDKELPPDHEVDDSLYYDVDSVQEIETHPLAENLFDNHGAYMFIGRAKIGKSRILGSLVAGALSGGKALNFSFNKKCKVLALTLEEDSFSLLSRIRNYMVEPLDYKGRFALIDEERLMANKAKYGDDYNWAQWLEIIVRKVKPDFMYVDTPVKLRMMWQNEPERKNKQVTEIDYQNAAELDRIAQKYHCVVVSVIHGSKRKPTTHGFDPFESIGTTSWTLAGCTGAMVLMDKPGHNPMEEEDDGQKVLSVRGRYQKTGDLHYLMQSNPDGTFSNMGDYRYVMSQVRAEEFLRVVKEGMDGGMEFVQARSIAQQTNRSERHVHVCLRQVIVEGKEYEGRKLIAVQGSGYALVAPNHSGKTKRPTRKQNGLTDEQNVLRDRANRKRASSEDQDDDPLAM